MARVWLCHLEKQLEGSKSPTDIVFLSAPPNKENFAYKRHLALLKCENISTQIQPKQMQLI